MGGFDYRSAAGTRFQFQRGLDNPPYSEGTLFYDENHKTLAQYNEEEDVIHQIGRELHDRVFNNLGFDVPNGTVLYITGAIPSSEDASIGLHTNAFAMANEPSTTKVFGVATHSIEDQSEGYATSYGLVHGIDTSAWLQGTVLYLSDIKAGEMTSVRPSPPNFPIRIATVTVQDADEGVIFVEIGPYDVTEHMVIEQLSIKNGLDVSNLAGVGIRLDVANPGFGYRDIVGNVTIQTTGAVKPAFVVYRDSIKQFRFEAGDEAYFDYVIPHDYVPGTDIFLNVHWSHAGLNVTGGSAEFIYEITQSKGYDQNLFPATVSNNLVAPASTVQFQHMTEEIQISSSTPSGSQIDTSELEPGGIVLCRLEMSINNIIAAGPVPDPFIHCVNLHYQSTNLATKNKSPNFYT